MNKTRFFVIMVLLASLLAGGLKTAQAAPAVPPNPSSFYGEIHVMAGDDVPAAGVDYVEAYVPGRTPYAARILITTSGSNLVYAINVPGDDNDTSGTKEGGVENDVVTFKISGRVVATGVWQGGKNVNLVIHPPAAHFGGPNVAVVNEATNFEVSATDWLTTDTFTYAWDLDGDGAYDDSTEEIPSYTFTTTGTKTVGMKVTDSRGGEDTLSTTVVVVDLGGLTGQTYDSTPKSVSVSGLVDPYTAEVTYDESATAPANAGSYAVLVTIKNGATAVGSINKMFVIDKRPITVTAATDSKIYDGTTSSVGVPTITSGNLVGSDTAIWSQTYDTKHVGAIKTLTPTGTVSDGNGGNNYLVTFVPSTHGLITYREITVTAAADNKGYDGTTSSPTAPTITSGGPLATGDSATWTQTFDNKNVGSGKTLTPAGTVNDGNGGNNYVVTFTSVSTGVITAKAITVTAATDSKGYDGTTSSVGIPTITSGGLLAPGDTVTWTQTFDNENAGTGKTLTPAGTVDDGNSGNNYAMTFTPDTSGVISQKEITVTAAADSKVYDGATSSVGVPTITSGGPLATGDSATWTQAFDNKNVGTGKTLTPAGSVDDGNSGNNYAVTFTSNTSGVITARPITVTADDKSKVVGAGDPPLTYQITLGTLVAPGDITGALAREAGETVGTYDILQNTLTAGSNYDLTYVAGTFTITSLQHSISLVEGWNLVSFDLVPTNPAVEIVLASLGTNYDLVYAWDATGGHPTSNWIKYDPTADPYVNTLATLDETMGFWIHMTTADVLEVSGTPPSITNIDLWDNAGGWNLVGLPSDGNPSILTLPGALEDHGVLNGNYTLLYAYHAADTDDPWKLYDERAPGYVNDLTTMPPSYGYWIFIIDDDTWEVEY